MLAQWDQRCRIANLVFFSLRKFGTLGQLLATQAHCIGTGTEHIWKILRTRRCFLLNRTKSIRTRMCFSISFQNKWWIRLCFHTKSKREIINPHVFKMCFHLDSLQRKTSKLSACVSRRTWERACVSAWKRKNDHGTRMCFHTTCLLHQETRMC